MNVIDLTDKHKQLYFVCLEDWSEEMNEAGNHKEIWYNEMKDSGNFQKRGMGKTLFKAAEEDIKAFGAKGPPLSYKKIKRRIAKRVKKL